MPLSTATPAGLSPTKIPSLRAERLSASTSKRTWRKLAKPSISQQEFDEFETTRRIRHEIVHRGRRLLHDDRGRAQRAVDTGRWLYNKIEGKPDRARLRDYGTLKSVGRSALALRFPSSVDGEGIVLRPLLPHSTPGPEDEND
jgi:hypothetical protein